MARRVCSLCGTPYLDEESGSYAVGPYAQTDADRHTAGDCLHLCEERLARTAVAHNRAVEDAKAARERVIREAKVVR